LAQLYDPDKMPKGLKEAFRLTDEAEWSVVTAVNL
jgi:hypothetical protein